LAKAEDKEPTLDSEPTVASAILEVGDRAAKLVHEEIELAKAEVIQKLSRLAKGVAVVVASGFFLMSGLLFLLFGSSWLFRDYVFTRVSFGFFIVGGGLILLGCLAGYIAYRAVKSALPPTPKLAMDEAKRIKETIKGSSAASDQHGKS